MSVTIVLPTKNSEKYLREVLAAIFRQKTDFAFEMTVIDSGSTDGTLSVVREFPQVRLVEIPPAEFGHGKTRNYAMTLSQSDYIVFLTHDATPSTDFWLANLVRDVKGDEKIAGGFGRHIPRLDCDPFEARTIENHFNIWLGGTRRVNEIVSGKEYPEEELHKLKFFSNANSIIKRSVWEKIPFKDVRMAEDQEWASDVLAAGYKTVYSHDGAVIHSHSERPFNIFRRSFDEYKALKRVHGYTGMKYPWQIFPWVARLTYSDLKYLWRQRNDLSIIRRLGWSWFACAKNVGKKTGEYLGTHHERLPKSWQERISFQERLTNKKQT
ncbi:MAG: glycosyltransferase family 2 protein [Parcubacteria group bacterium]|nr:glycosyltransferase family 2 protein [Parcubacteria group bacterium]